MKRQKPYIIKGLRVEVFNGNFDKALRQFKKKVQNEGVIQEIRDRQYYEKPSEIRQRRMNAAKRRTAKQVRDSRVQRT